MRERSKNETARPLPRGSLPDSLPLDGDPKWEESVERIMAAAGPGLRTLGSRRSAAAVTWWSSVGLWWKSAAVLAAASLALFLLVGRGVRSSEPPPSSIPVALVASDGDAVMLWEIFGVQADPVLALIALREQRDATGQRVAPIIRKEERR